MINLYSNAQNCSILCNYIYFYKRPPKIKTYCIINKRNPRCILYTLKNDINVYIVIRGTDPSDFNNIYINFEYKLVNTPEFKCKIHKGFYNYFLNLKQKLEFQIKKYNNSNIILTGHSMGGCIAILASYYFNTNCITFGTPPMCRRKFKLLYNENLKKNTKYCINFKNLYDPIPSICNSKTLFFAILNIASYIKYKIYKHVELPGIYININKKNYNNHLMATYVDILKIIKDNKRVLNNLRIPYKIN